jgi:hypothetical protein
MGVSINGGSPMWLVKKVENTMRMNG